MGFLNGASYSAASVCVSGLTNYIAAVFNVLEHTAIYIPSNTVKFSIALNDLQSASNTIYG